MKNFFTVEKTDPGSKARLGKIRTAHGVVDTPAFMPVGSQGTVKSLTPEDLTGLGAQMILGNAYHLNLRPGHRLIRDAGGLHRFMGWNGSILTDSGGFQIYSLATLCRVSDAGVKFRSHIDGSLHSLTPARVIEIQEAIGADIIMVLDDCPGLPAPVERIRESVDRTILWARQCRNSWRRTDDQALFGIVQGGCDIESRLRCLENLVEMDFPGFAIGGLSVGESRDQMAKVVSAVAPAMPADKPRYLMGVGRPEELVRMVAEGVDLFDCVMPTRNARNGSVFTPSGTLNIKNSVYREDFRPVEEGCPCYGCTHLTRAYLRHLFQSKELLSFRLNTLHNLSYYFRLLRTVRRHLDRGTFVEFMQLIEK